MMVRVRADTVLRLTKLRPVTLLTGKISVTALMMLATFLYNRGR